ncbi:MAG: hypothetical protein LBU60_03755 [Clostridiales bacterium]|nr:hypothetical protein [Clostridiales bacterium]
MVNSLTGQLNIVGEGVSTFRVRHLGDSVFAPSDWSEIITITVQKDDVVQPPIIPEQSSNWWIWILVIGSVLIGLTIGFYFYTIKRTEE